MKIRVALVLGIVVWLGNVTAFGAVVDWNGSDGDWNTASNWTIQDVGGNKVPTNGDTANVAAGTATSSSSFVATNMIYNLSGTGNIVLGGADFTLNINTTVNQSGGKFSMSHASDQWLNIGENSASRSTYIMTGGEIDQPLGNSYLVVGRRGPGDMTVSGNSTISVGNFWIGYETLRSGDSTMNLNGGTLTVRGSSAIGGSSGYSRIDNTGTSTFNIAGGTYNSKGAVNIGNYFSAMDATSGVAIKTVMNVSDGAWTADGEVNLGVRDAVGSGNSNTVNVNFTGGTSVFKGLVHIGQQANVDATMTISDNANVTFEKDLYVGVNGSARANLNLTGGNATFLGKINVDSGTFTSSVGTLDLAGASTSKLNIGHKSGSTGTFKVTAGTVSVTMGKISETVNHGEWYVGKNGGTGILEVTGGTLNVNTTASVVRLGSGANTTGELRVSGTGNLVFTGNDLHVGFDGGTGIITQTGGTLTTNCWFNIGEYGTGTYNLSGGTLNTKNALCVGRRGPGTMTVSGTGKFAASGTLYIGMFPAYSGVSTLNIQSKGNTAAGMMYVSGGGGGTPAAGSVGTLNIESGDLSVAGQCYIGYSTTGVLNIKNGGTIYAPDSDFTVGNGNANGKVVIFDGGTYNQAGKGNFIVRSTTGTDADGSKGSVVELHEGGTLDTLWLSLGQEGQTDGTCNFNMTGGTLKIGNSGSNTFRIGYEFDSHATISGGSIYVSGPVQLARAANSANSSLSIIGSKSTWDVNTLDLVNGTLNVTADALSVNGEGKLSGGVSTLAARSTAKVASTVNIDMTDAVYDGIAFLSAAPVLTLISSTGLTLDQSKINLQGGDWKLNVTGTNVELYLDDTNFAMSDGSGVMSGNMELGWAKTDRDTARFYYGEGEDATELVTWIQDQLPEANAGIKVTDTGSFIEFSNIPLGADGFAYVPFSLAAFNAANGTDFQFQNLPEPTTWGMFVLGALLLGFWKIRKNSNRSGI